MNHDDILLVPNPHAKEQNSKAPCTLYLFILAFWEMKDQVHTYNAQLVTVSLLSFDHHKDENKWKNRHGHC